MSEDKLKRAAEFSAMIDRIIAEAYEQLAEGDPEVIALLAEVMEKPLRQVQHWVRAGALDPRFAASYWTEVRAKNGDSLLLHWQYWKDLFVSGAVGFPLLSEDSPSAGQTLH